MRNIRRVTGISLIMEMFFLSLTVTGFSAAFLGEVKAASPSMPCDYYASRTGGGDGLSPSTPFKIQQFWSRAKPGTTLCLLDGVYTGPDSMITPPANLSGEPGNPIGIRALNDGKVTLNGEFVRQPVHLRGNDYFVLEGFNAHSSSLGVVTLEQGSDHNVVLRVVAWDAPIDWNAMVFATNHSIDNLFEDVAGFGTGRKIFTCAQRGDGCTFRRAWGRWEGSINTGPKLVATLYYNTYRTTFENIIGTWSGEKMPESYTLMMNGEVSNPANPKTYTNYQVANGKVIFGNDSMPHVENKVTNSKLLGSIAYQQDSDRSGGIFVAFGSGGGGKDPRYHVDGVEIRDVIAFSPPSKRSWQTGFYLSNTLNSVPQDVKILNSISFAQKNTISNVWQVSNFLETQSTGAEVWNSICYRYVNGVKTNEPLWPWPMNQRIIDALQEAGKTAVDVTQTIEAMFGPVPDHCQASGTTSTESPSAPKNLRIALSQ